MGTIILLIIIVGVVVVIVKKFSAPASGSPSVARPSRSSAQTPPRMPKLSAADLSRRAIDKLSTINDTPERIREQWQSDQFEPLNLAKQALEKEPKSEFCQQAAMKVWTYLGLKMIELKDYESADEICTDAPCSAQPDDAFIKMFFETSMWFDQKIVEPLRGKPRTAETLALSERVLDRASRSMIGAVNGYMTNAEVGQRFGWAAELNPDDGYALYREGMFIYLNTKQTLEGGSSDIKWAKKALNDATERLKRAAILIPDNKDVDYLLRSIDSLIAQCS